MPSRKSKSLPSQLYRTIDANLNRAREGLRVCEDINRFWYNQTRLTRALKDLRQELTALAGAWPLPELLDARDTGGDVGRRTTPRESRRRDQNDIFYANLQRVKESVRVLEEVSKLKDPRVAEQWKKFRYKVYAVEKRISV